MLDEILRDIAAQLKRIADELEAQGRKNIVTNEDFTRSFDRFQESRLSADTQISKLHEISEFGTVRFFNICERAGIKTLGELASLSEKQFWLNKYCGWKTVREARMILSAAGLQFRV